MVYILYFVSSIKQFANFDVPDKFYFQNESSKKKPSKTKEGECTHVSLFRIKFF